MVRSNRSNRSITRLGTSLLTRRSRMHIFPQMQCFSFSLFPSKRNIIFFIFLWKSGAGANLHTPPPLINLELDPCILDSCILCARMDRFILGNKHLLYVHMSSFNLSTLPSLLYVLSCRLRKGFKEPNGLRSKNKASENMRCTAERFSILVSCGQTWFLKCLCWFTRVREKESLDFASMKNEVVLALRPCDICLVSLTSGHRHEILPSVLSKSWGSTL